MSSQPKKLEQQILQILANKGQLPAKQIQDFLLKKEVSVTIQGIYRVLRKLHSEGVVTKAKHDYGIWIPWIFEHRKLIDAMERTYFQEQYLLQLVPRFDGEKRVWYFSDPLKMTSFWDQILIAMTKSTGERVSLSYCPHAWYELIQPQQTAQFVKTYFDLVRSEYSIIGGRTYLDQYTPPTLAPHKKEHCYFAPPKDYIEADRSMHIGVVGPYILSIQIEKAFAEEIDAWYNSTKNENDIHLLNTLGLFSKKTKIKVVLRHDVNKARKYYKKFERIFGPLR